MAAGVYMIENTANGKRYIGSAVRLSWRETKHRLHLSRGTHHSRHLQRAWDKHGEGNFRFVTLLYCDKANVIFYEQRLLDGLRPEYNVCKKATSCLGVKRTEEFKRKLGASRKGRRVPEETKAKISASLAGRVKGPLPDETRRRLSESSARRANGEGRSHMLALAQAKRGVARTEEVKMKLARAGSKFTDDQIRTIRKKAGDGTLNKVIAAEFGVSTSCIGEITRRNTYRWVD